MGSSSPHVVVGHRARLGFMCKTVECYQAGCGVDLEILLPEPSIKEIIITCRRCGKKYIWNAAARGHWERL